MKRNGHSFNGIFVSKDINKESQSVVCEADLHLVNYFPSGDETHLLYELATNFFVNQQ